MCKYKNAESSAATCKEKTFHIINVPNDGIGNVESKTITI